MVREVNQLDSSLKWFTCSEIYNICWKIIPYIYYSHTKEGTSRCTATKRLKTICRDDLWCLHCKLQKNQQRLCSWGQKQFYNI